MKKLFCLLLVVFFLVGCSCKKETTIEIPSKKEASSNSVVDSPITSQNLDTYLFRDDVKYIDLRSSKMVLEEGYVSGFEFIPFYSIIASFSDHTALYRMKNITGTNITAGQTGSFIAQYEESETIINSLIPKDKYVFFISQGGSECSYMINLLIQLGYDGNLLYNVGGVSNSEGISSYKSIKTNKYYVEGIGDYKVSISYNFLEELTPIN